MMRLLFLSWILFVSSALSACYSLNPDQLTPYEQARLACTLETGQQEQGLIIMSGDLARVEDDFDRRQLDYHACLMARGF
ncbi:hypothetical protein SAMN05421831_10148 [Allopseudospirillum japonicum]|uniref:Lipoprotein n=1 Tax=Allopseudospirillum japonicum TaxID=64971 RepID=A0A1H6Q0U2_9GAMM|nr:hypothetical protein [Allopseudospirillum japonicum]SEI37479.1 hypothetical protein SAMN05421831_10148 [Allopseudospirillum japonicum]